jgi:hypothetical protein
MPGGYTYSVRLTPTSISAAKTLIQIKTGAAPVEIIRVRVTQSTLTAIAYWNLQLKRSSAAATVTSFTPLKYNPNDPISLAVGGTAATGVNASVEGTDTDIDDETQWNVINGEWVHLPVPEERIWIPQSSIWGVKLNTAPSVASLVGAIVVYREWQ